MPDVIEYLPGQPITASATFYEEDGVTPATPATVSLQLYLPSGASPIYTLADADIEALGAGGYRWVGLATEAGYTQAVWRTTNPIVVATDGWDTLPLPPPTKLIGLNDVAVVLQRTFTARQASAAAEVIRAVEDEAEAWLGRGLVVAEHTEVLPGPFGLPYRWELTYGPVRSVVSASVDGTAVDPTYLDLDPVGRGFPSLTVPFGSTLTITYVGGLDAASLPLASKVLEVAAREVQRQVLDRMPAVVAVSVEGQSLRYLGGWSEADRRAISRWRRR